MSFMQRQILKSAYFAVETSAGTEVVPVFVFTEENNKQLASAKMLQPYCEGDIKDKAALYRAREPAFLARLSAPGFLDATNWTAFKSEREAADYLDDLTGDEPHYNS